MKANAIICEYNPFHNGHKYQIDNVKKLSDNPVVAIMSGNFTQRGDISIRDKFARAEYALKNGTDIVVELPAVYATSNAEIFAKAGVKIADALGCCENLCFSTESGNDKFLPIISEAFENHEFINSIKEYMSTGTYYPKAVEMALEKLYSEKVADIIREPNNVLGIEYLKALKNTDISPMIITRTAVGHNEEKCVGNITSASNIRKMIYQGDKNYADYIPAPLDFSNFASLEKLEKIIIYKLRSMSNDDIEKITDVTEGLENRIYDAARNYNSLTEILEKIKTKRYTMARLRRILIHALLGITKEDTQITVPYIRILGFNPKGQELLKDIKAKCRLPLVINVGKDYRNLDENAKRIFDKDILATDIYSLGTDIISEGKRDFTQSIIKV